MSNRVRYVLLTLDHIERDGRSRFSLQEYVQQFTNFFQHPPARAGRGRRRQPRDVEHWVACREIHHDGSPSPHPPLPGGEGGTLGVQLLPQSPLHSGGGAGGPTGLALRPDALPAEDPTQLELRDNSDVEVRGNSGGDLYPRESSEGGDHAPPGERPFHYHIGFQLSGTGVDRRSLTPALRQFVNDTFVDHSNDTLFPGRTFNVRFHRDFARIVAYTTKEDTTPLTGGTIDWDIRTVIDNAPGARRSAAQLEPAHLLGVGWDSFITDSRNLTLALSSYGNLRFLHTDYNNTLHVRKCRELLEEAVSPDTIPYQPIELTPVWTMIFKWFHVNLLEKRLYKQKQMFIWGAPDVGKSSIVRALVRLGLSVYYPPARRNCWNGYADHKYHLMFWDEFTTDYMSTEDFKKLLCGDPISLDGKYAQMINKTENGPILMASNDPPPFDDGSTAMAAFSARNYIYHVDRQMPGRWDGHDDRIAATILHPPEDDFFMDLDAAMAGHFNV